MRRHDRAITDEEALNILRKGEYGILSMCTPDNEGYGIPLNYVIDHDKIYFHCAQEGSKLEFLSINNKASFCVVGDTRVIPAEFGTLYESVIVSGIVSEAEGKEKEDALMLLIRKYSAGFIEEGKRYISDSFDQVKVLRLSIRGVTGKARRV